MRPLALALLLTLVDVAAAQNGILLMAHGGSETWNGHVQELAASLPADVPVRVAFGMANPETLEAAVTELEREGVTTISVIRLFVSAESFLAQTQFAFGLTETPPAGHFMHEPRPITVNADVRLSTQGLMDAPVVGLVLADRARALSSQPDAESVLIVGHGPASDEENERWLQAMDRRAEVVRCAAPFYQVTVATLREDWTGKREAAEANLREIVSGETDAGRAVIVIPFRLSGFGPYADVLEGMAYRADSTGFLPDARLADWVMEQHSALLQANSPVAATGTHTPTDSNAITCR